MSDAKRSEAMAKLGPIGRLTIAADSALARTFYSLGLKVGRNPWKTVLVSLLFVVACCSGFSQFYSESRNEFLWVPSGTEGSINFADFSQYFTTSRFNRYAVQSADGNTDKNMLSKDNLLAAFDLQTEVLAANVTDGDEVFDFRRLVAPGSPPFPLGLLALWPVRFMLEMETDESILAKVTAAVEEDPNLGVNLGGVQRDTVTGQIIFSDTLLSIYFLTANQTLSSATQLWEQKFINITLDGSEFDVNPAVDSAWTERVAAYPFAQRTFSDAFGEVVQGDTSLLAASYIMISVYVLINFGSCDAVENKVVLSCLVILTNVLAIGAGFGMSSLFGLFFGPLHSVLPLLVLGIGVDDAFVQVNAFSRTNINDPLAIRSAHALRHAGASITVTSATDVIAFAVGSFTSLPALRSFCLFASVTLFMVYALSITFFQAVLILDARRRVDGRYDILCCVRSGRTKNNNRVTDADRATEANDDSSESEMEKQGLVSRFLENIYGPFITSNFGIVCALLLCAGLTTLGVFGLLNLSVEATANNFIPDDSYAKETLRVFAEGFSGLDDNTAVIIKDIDYFERQDDILTIVDTFSDPSFQTEVPFLRQPLPSNWYERFLGFVNVTLLPEQVDSQGRPATREIWDEAIVNFVENGDSGNDVILRGNKIVRSRIRMRHPPIGELNEDSRKFRQDTALQVKTMETMYELTRSIDFNSENEVAYAFAIKYVNEWETFKIISRELIQNISLALVCVFVITTVLIGHPLASFLVFCCVMLTILQLLGVSWAWGLSIDTVAVVNLVIAVGLAVDYAAHIGHNFMLKTGTRRERVAKALTDIGTPVLNGAVSTALAISTLSLSKSYVFRVLFQQFFGACTLGIVNGLITLPALLALMGPPSIHDVLEFADSDSDLGQEREAEAEIKKVSNPQMARMPDL